MTQLEAVKQTLSANGLRGEHTLYEAQALYERTEGVKVSDAGISARLREYKAELRAQGMDIKHRCLPGQSTRVYWIVDYKHGLTAAEAEKLLLA